MLYEVRKHDGSLPIVGVNMFTPPEASPSSPTSPSGGEPVAPVELTRSTEAEKRRQLDRLASFQERHAEDRPAALDRLRAAALAGENTFAVLMDAVRVCSLGEITSALFEVGGQYRRNV